MKTKSTPSVRQLVLTALFLALAFVLPLLTGQVPKVGNMLCPMHFPVLLCGFVLGGPWGLAVGFAAPLLRSVLFGMPPLFPTAIAMCFELMTYGFVAGFLYNRSRWQCVIALYRSMIASMVAGRLVWGVAQIVLLGLSGSAFTLQAFMAGALLNAIPGIVLQLLLIPAIMVALNRTGLVPFKQTKAVSETNN